MGVVVFFQEKLYLCVEIKQFLYDALKSFMSTHQRKMTLLEDNHAGALYNYLISVQTGHRKNAGTSANVRVVHR